MAHSSLSVSSANQQEYPAAASIQAIQLHQHSDTTVGTRSIQGHYESTNHSPVSLLAAVERGSSLHRSTTCSKDTGGTWESQEWNHQRVLALFPIWRSVSKVTIIP
jgi:hypothetical protein